MSSNTLVYRIYRNEGDLRHTFEHLVLRSVIIYNQWLIRELVSIVLQENVFVFDKKIYELIFDDAPGSSFTLTLANIFMCIWQREFIRRQGMLNEFYDR